MGQGCTRLKASLAQQDLLPTWLTYMAGDFVLVVGEEREKSAKGGFSSSPRETLQRVPECPHDMAAGRPQGE